MRATIDAKMGVDALVPDTGMGLPSWTVVLHGECC